MSQQGKISPVKINIAYELHKPARRTYQRRRVVTRGKDDLWQADLVEMIPYASSNKGYKYLLTVIDVYSKFAFAEPVRSKSALHVKNAFERIIQLSKRRPRLLQTDQGKEFYNTVFSSYLKREGIHHYSTYSALKACVVERFNRTLKTMMWREFTAQGSYCWINLLPRLMSTYNDTFHRTIGTKPRLVTKNTSRLDAIHLSIKTVDPRRQRFKKGDFVRISKHKTVFAKGYTPNWSTEIFQIKNVKRTNPVTYLLQDLSGQPIEGGFYIEELQKTKYPDHYLIEHVIRRRGNKLYVKWLGFNNNFNSWINKEDVL